MRLGINRRIGKEIRGKFGGDSMIVVLTTYPDSKSARMAAREIVSGKLAACASIINIEESYYRWEGRLERQPEFMLLIKTTKTAYPKLEKFIKKSHPHKVPEIIWLDAKGGLVEYLAWVQANSG
jgi:periplasmic divalent cation tolerance protein